MKTPIQILIVALLVGSACTGQLFAQGTAFTYQGRFTVNGAPYTGNAEFQATLWNAVSGGSQIAANSPAQVVVGVTNGLFVLPLDFGASFPGADRWLQLEARTTIGPFTTLTPRQPLTPTPYAIYSANAGAAATAITATSATSATTANNFSGSLSGNVTGAQGATVVATVGGQTAANVASGASAANAATSANTANIIVKRDASGNFSAGTITATSLTGTFNGNGGGLTNVTAASLAIPPGMVLIPAGSFTMGDSLDGLSDAVPITVNVSAFYMDVNLVSWSQWQSVIFWAADHGYNFNFGAGKAANHPVQTVDWYDCVKWCNARSEQAGKTPVYYTDAGLTAVYKTEEVTVYVNWAASGYRLPTEAEWEKAARGGLSGQRFPWGNVITQNLANYFGNTGFSYDYGPNGYNAIGSFGGTSPATSPVGSFAANGYGLYDMAGNVFQWCWDWFGTPYAGGSDPHGPAGPLSYRVLRGGSWNSNAGASRCAFRLNFVFAPPEANAVIGFRCVRGL